MESVYRADPNLVVQPAYYSGGVPVFTPTMAQFEDFYTFNKAINVYGMQSGIVKIVPPSAWRDSLAGNYTAANLAAVKVKNPIVQHINACAPGVYSQQNVERARGYTIAQWKDLASKSNYLPPAPRGRHRGENNTQARTKRTSARRAHDDSKTPNDSKTPARAHNDSKTPARRAPQNDSKTPVRAHSDSKTPTRAHDDSQTPNDSTSWAQHNDSTSRAPQNDSQAPRAPHNDCQTHNDSTSRAPQNDSQAPPTARGISHDNSTSRAPDNDSQTHNDSISPAPPNDQTPLRGHNDFSTSPARRAHNDHSPPPKRQTRQRHTRERERQNDLEKSENIEKYNFEKSDCKAAKSDNIENFDCKAAKTNDIEKSAKTNSSDNSSLDSSSDSYNIDTSEFDASRCDQLEKIYWKSLTYAEPMYGADVMGTLFGKNIKSWNVAHLPNILDLMDARLPGVNDAYLYAGLWKATFAWHLEDQDLYSINYIHFGAPKQWYSIPQAESGRFFDLMKETFDDEYKNCPEFLRHKTFLVSPQFLEKHGIRYNKIVHNEGEFMITYPYGYHAGFNYGYNLAESVNFALDDWFPFGEKTQKCECISDSVGINVKRLYCRYKGLPYDHESAPGLASDQGEETEDEEITVPLERKLPVGKKNQAASSKKQPARRQPRSTSKAEPAPKRAKTSSQAERAFNNECYLCPNNLPHSMKAFKQFQLLDTDLKNEKTGSYYKVHGICALSLPTQLTVDLARGSVSGFEQLSRPQYGLRCHVCDPINSSIRKPSRRSTGSASMPGVCFQCDHDRCSRAYHATCALGGGVLFDQSEPSKNRHKYCKYHRNKVSRLNAPVDENLVKLSMVATNSLIQFAISKPNHVSAIQGKDFHCGLVTSNNVEEQSMDVLIYPALEDKMEVQYSDVVAGSGACVDNSLFHSLQTASDAAPATNDDISTRIHGPRTRNSSIGYEVVKSTFVPADSNYTSSNGGTSHFAASSVDSGVGTQSYLAPLSSHLNATRAISVDDSASSLP